MTKTLSRLTILFLFFGIILSCQQKSVKKEKLQKHVQSQINAVNGDVAVAFLNLTDTLDNLFINIDEKFHAASTMKQVK